MDHSEDRFVRFRFPYGASLFEQQNRFRQASTASSPSPLLIQQKPSETNVSQSTIARMHISNLTPKIFDREFRQQGVPLIIEGALDELPADAWKLHNFIKLFDAEDAYQCRIHGGDRFATTPDAWQGRTHARHVVVTTPSKFADTINTGIAAREDCYVQADVQASRAGQALAPHLARIGERCGLRLHQEYGGIINMWWGPSGHTEPLHMDATDGTLCQLR